MFYILRDMAQTHPDILYLFEGFKVGTMGNTNLIYNGKASSNSSRDQ